MTAPDALAKRIEDAERKAKEAADKLKQLKATKAAIEARQKAIEAKRTKAAEQKRMSEVGNLARMAGLLELDNATLLGALMIAANKIDDLAYLAEARERGEAVLARSTKPGGSAATQATA